MSTEVAWGNWEPSKSKPNFTFGEMADQEYDRFNKAEKASAYVEGVIGAYDRRNDEIFKTTGEKLFNPLRDIPSNDDLTEMQAAYREMVAGGVGDKSRTTFQQEWFASKYEKRLKELAEKHPQHMPVIKADRSPILDYAEIAQAAERKSADMAERLGMVDVRDSMPALKKVPVLPDIANLTANLATNPTATIAQFWGGFKAQMQDPFEASLNLMGFGAGKASMSVLKTALLNAGANAAMEAAAQPIRQTNRKDLGLEYGWERFFADVSGAAATGAMLDAGVRIPYRAAVTRFGRDTPEGTWFSKQGRGGILTDAIPQTEPIKPIVREQITPDEIERAKANDLDAIESIARKTGALEDPGVKGAINYAKLTGKIDDAMVERFKAMGLDHGEGMGLLKTAIELGGRGYVRAPDPIPEARAPLDTAGAAELAPRLAEIEQRLAGAPQEVREAVRAGVEIGAPEIVKAARAALSGDLEGMRAAIAEAGGETVMMDRVTVHTSANPVAVARALRRSPQVMDSNVPMRSEFMRTARAVAALDDAAFDMVLRGQAHPKAGELVANMVPPGQHAEVLRSIEGFRDIAEAKEAIPDMIREGTAEPDNRVKVSDPSGPDAKAQVDALEKAHAKEVEAATEPARKREELESKVETLKGEIAKLEEQQGKMFAIKDGDKLSMDQKIQNWEAIDKFFRSLPRETRREIGDGFDVVRSTSNNYVHYDIVESGKSRWADDGSSNSLGTFSVKASQRVDVAGVESTNSRLTESLQRQGIGTKVYDLIDEDMKQVGGLSPSPRNQLSSIAVSFWQKRLGNDLFAIADRGKATLDEAALSPADKKLLDKLTERTGLKPDELAEQRAQGQQFGKKIDAALDKATKFEGTEKAADELAQKRMELRQAEIELERVQMEQARAIGDPALYRMVMERAAVQRRLDVKRSLDDALRLGDRMLPEGTKVEVRADEMRDPTTGSLLDASSDMTTGDIALASYALNPAGRMGHEGVHTLVTRGHISPQEIKMLAKLARERDLFKTEAKYREAYAGRDNLDSLIDEEAAAHAIEARINGTDLGPANTMADRIKQLIERIKNALSGYGFRTADDVARAIIDGEAAQRQANVEWMRGEVRQKMQEAAERGVTLPDGTQVKGVPIYAIRAYHGSPHNFDKFDVGKYGSGDGMSAVRGIWLSDNKDVGAAYAGRMDRSGVKEPHADLVAYFNGLRLPDGIAKSAAYRVAVDGGIGAALAKTEAAIKRDTSRGLNTSSDQKLRDALRSASKYDGPIIKEQPTAKTYEVNVAAEQADMIDFSKPLAEQNNAIKQLAAEFGGSSPMQVYNAVVSKLGMDAGTAEFLRRGVKGFSYIDNEFADGARNYVVFDDSLIEIVAKDGKPVNREQMYALADVDTGRSMRRDFDQLGYYSKALEAAKAWPQTKGTSEQALKWLEKSGVKAAEIEATNLAAFLDGKKSITRDEIVKHLTENRVGVMESEYGPRMDAESVAARNELEAVERRIREIPSGTRENPNPEYDILNNRRFELGQIIKDRPTKWSNYSLDPSNPTYRETVLHLPLDRRMSFDEFLAAYRNRFPNATDVPDAEVRGMYDKGIEIPGVGQTITQKPDVAFQSGHFSEPNIIGHMMTSLNKHEGRPVYTLDQIQSDWGQKLRDGGVRDEKKIAELKRLKDETADQWEAFRIDAEKFAKDNGADPFEYNTTKSALMHLAKKSNDPAVVQGAENRLAVWDEKLSEARRYSAEYETESVAAPGNPLVNTTDQWTTTTLRRAIRQAVEADAEFIAIPSGDTVLSYNPGDASGMKGFYGALPNREAASQTYQNGLEGIVPKNLRKILEKIDKDSAKPTLTDKLETPSGMKGSGFTLFPITDKVKRSVMDEGQAMFALSEYRRGREVAEPENLWFWQQPQKSGTVLMYHATNRSFDKFDMGMSSDFGIHFGSARQAAQRLSDTGRIEGGRTIPAEVTVNNAITMGDLGFWGPVGMATALQRQGYKVTAEEWKRFTELADAIDQADADVQRIGNSVKPRLKSAVNAANDAIKAKLDKLGIDGIWYKNTAEGRGWSLAVWNEGQVKSAITGEQLYAMSDGAAPIEPLKSDMAAVDRMSQLRDLIEACRA